MSKFKESFTTDIAIIKQWERDMCIKFDNDSGVELHVQPKGNRILCYVLNTNNGKTFRCIVPKYMSTYGIARCYARAIGQKVKTLVTQVSMKTALQNPEFICRPIYYVTNAAGVTHTELGKYKLYCGNDAKQIAEDALNLGTMSDNNTEFYIKTTHIYDL